MNPEPSSGKSAQAAYFSYDVLKDVGDVAARETRTDECDYRVSKLRLVSGLQAGLHSGVLRWSKKLREAKTLAIELQDCRANIGETGFARFGAREGAHDDLVLAVAIGR